MQDNKKQKPKSRVLSGVQPSAGQVHVGNYLGAMKRFVSLAKEEGEKGGETIFCIVDLHALTSVKEAKLLREFTTSLTAAHLAIGIDPAKTILFRQSDIPEVCELSWYLSCNFPLGLLNRAHALKDSKAKKENTNSGLMYYPILMAADILLYKATKIPVGADQKQHLEMTREIAQKMNLIYGDIFPVPEPLIEESTGVIPGLDGRKMSKSYDNYIGLFETEKKLEKKVKKIVTDSLGVEDKKDPETCNVFKLYKFFANKNEQAELAEKYKSGGMGYGEAKMALFHAMNSELGPFREKYEELISRPKDLEDVLEDGGKRAREIAKSTIDEVRGKLGVGALP